MPTTVANYEPNDERLSLWLREPEVFSYLDRLPADDPDAFTFRLPVFGTSWIASVDRRMEEEGWVAPSEPAYPFDVRNIPNGRYALEYDTGETDYYESELRETIHYQIYTVTSGRWAGRRVIKHRGESNRYSAFAFLNADASWTLWSRFRSQSESSFIRFTPALLEAIQQLYLTQRGLLEEDEPFWESSLEGQNFSVAVQDVNCRICNARTTPVLQVCQAHLQDHYSSAFRTLREEGVPTNRHTVPVVMRRTASLPMCEVHGIEVQ